MRKSGHEFGSITVMCLLFVLSFIIAGCSVTIPTLEAGAGTVPTQRIMRVSETPALFSVLPKETAKSLFGDLGYLQIADVENVIATNSYNIPEIKIIVESAASLIGKVQYFWGGKSYAKGFDPSWGEMRRVTGGEHETTGTVVPFGLDCSGYVLWCFIQAYGRSKTLNEIGEGTWFQWSGSDAVEIDSVMVGDLAFINRYPGANGNHVGIVIGFLTDGEAVIAHCSDTQGKVVASICGTEFKFFRRPRIYHNN